MIGRAAYSKSSCGKQSLAGGCWRHKTGCFSSQFIRFALEAALQF